MQSYLRALSSRTLIVRRWLWTRLIIVPLFFAREQVVRTSPKTLQPGLPLKGDQHSIRRLIHQSWGCFRTTTKAGGFCIQLRSSRHQPGLEQLRRALVVARFELARAKRFVETAPPSILFP